MTRMASRNKDMAMKVAARVAAEAALDEEEAGEVEALEAAPTPAEPPPQPVPSAPATPSPAPAKRGRGRPKSRRPVEARLTVYLDATRHGALSVMAEDRGRSIHSLIIEGIDSVIGRPVKTGWPPK